MAERRTADGGFTLVETTIVVILFGVVSAVIGLAITTTLRATPPTTANLDDTRSVLGLITWLPRDVASTPPDGANISPTPASLTCIGSEVTAGDNLLELRWVESDGPPVTYVAAYRAEPTGDGKAVWRYHCSDASGSFDDTDSTKVSAELADSFTVVANPPWDRVAITVQNATGETFQVAATPRGPDEMLPTTTLAPPPSAPAPCSVTFDSVSPSPVGRYALTDPFPEELLAPVDLGFTVTGDTCGTLTVDYDTGYELKSRTIVVTGNIGKATIPEGDNTSDTPPWTAGTKTLEVHNDGTPMGVTATLEVT